MSIQQFIKTTARSQTEEEVKAAYIKWLGLSGDIRSKTDLQARGVLWEFKNDKNLKDVRQLATIIAQVTYYLRRQQRSKAGDLLPGLVAVADKNEAAIVPSASLQPFFDTKIDWRKAACKPDQKLIDRLTELSSGVRVYRMTEAVECEAFAQALENGGQPIARIVTVDNFEAAFVAWRDSIGRHFSCEEIGLCFMADLSQTNAVYSSDGRLRLIYSGRVFEAHVPQGEYLHYWQIWDRPPHPADYQRMVSHADRLRVIDDRRRFGVFYTPLPVCKLALEYLSRQLGDDWQDQYYVWDCCCGTGNLTYYMDRYDRCFLSTIDQREVDFIRENGLADGATVFQYDYCNDDIDKMVAGDDLMGDGWKMPRELRRVLKEEPEKLIVLMNPPYAAGTDGAGGSGVKRVDVTNTVAKTAFGDTGKAQQELFTQFIARSAVGHRCGVLAVLSKVNLLNNEEYGKVRRLIHDYSVVRSFCFSSLHFGGVKGTFPINFYQLRRGNEYLPTTRNLPAEQQPEDQEHSGQICYQ